MWTKADSFNKEQERIMMEAHLEAWCERLLDVNFEVQFERSVFVEQSCL